MKLGIDIGRVLIAPDSGDRNDTSFIGGSIDDALATPPYPGMFDAVIELARRFDHRVWLVSKCHRRVQEKSRLWLDHHRFFERTGIPAENLRFCLERPQKALHCAELGISHFIDDRSDVLHHLAGIVPHRFLFGPQRPGMPTEHGVVACVDWPTTVAAVMTTLR